MIIHPPAPCRNLELKARCHDLDLTRRLVVALGARFLAIESQTDTFFQVRSGRLKLRQLDDAAVLVAYHRDDAIEIRPSDYYLIPVADPAALCAALAATLGIRAIVKKQREIHLYHNVRIHLDRVEQLGDFVELEAVLDPNHSEDVSTARLLLDEIAVTLGIVTADHVASAYVDLLPKGAM
jgi:predicted adenylyl cyclase CyaB